MIKTSSGTRYYTQQEVNNKINEVMEDGYKITNAIYEKAREMDWCSEYDDWAYEVNKDLKFFEVPTMRSEYAVTYTLTRYQEVEVTVQVTARDEDNAEDQAEEIYCLNDLIKKADEDEWVTKNEEIKEVKAQEI